MKDWRLNGIKVPYGFVIWALRDAMTHPSSATEVLDEFLREEWDELGTAYHREILKTMDLHLRMGLPEHPVLAEAMLRDRREVWSGLYDDLKVRP